MNVLIISASYVTDVNGHHPPPQSGKGKKRNDVPIDPATMYESLKNRIAALEEEEVLEEEEERRFGSCNFPATSSLSSTFSGLPRDLHRTFFLFFS